MPEFTGELKKQLRRLHDLAYQTELDGALGDLHAKFTEWREKRIDCFQLSDLIHEFHQEPNRQLYLWYTGFKPHDTVALAIARGVIPREKVPVEVLEVLADGIAFHVQSDGAPG